MVDKKKDIYKLLKQHESLSKILKKSEQLLHTSHGSITIHQYYLLVEILDKGVDFKSTSFADSLGQQKASISIQISKMIKKGYLTVTIDVNDRRKHYFSLTSNGQQVYEELLEEFYDLLSKENLNIYKQVTRFMESLKTTGTNMLIHG